ncbi:unnamed protein product [Plutella xylostella]|uniref:15-hydroxyprostaglandin dehydrogenase [NAD(+)] n=1 Tax=Plutella xylostella TaxID=51655 RepID=A0A8S4DH06_PLUXY|nr:unnamed protein product [Plutella xylostella]
MVWDEVKQCLVLSDAVCLVTGGAAGVGAALVSSLLTENAQHVAFLDIEEKKGAALETQLNAKFGALRAKFIKCDIANEDELTRAYKLVTDKYRRLDVVVNNAAVLSRDGENSGRMVDVNFKASVNSTFKAVEAMSAENGGSGGVVVNISSLLALNQDSRLAVYSATKAAVLQFTVTLGKEPFYTNSKVRLLTVCPGPTDTAIYHRQNLQNHPAHLTQPYFQKQSVESAVLGIIEVIKTGASGSVWKVADDEPAQDISQHVKKGFTVFSSVVKK